MFNKYNYNTKHMAAFPSMLYRVLYWRKIDWGVGGGGGLPELHSFKLPMWLLCTVFWASIFCTFYPPKISWSLYMFPEAACTWQYLAAPCTPGGNEELCLTLLYYHHQNDFRCFLYIKKKKVSSLSRNSGHSSCKSSTHIPTSVCSISMCPHNGMAPSIWFF